MRFVLVFALLLYSYLCHVTRNLPEGISYISLDASGNISMYWSLDYDQEYVKIEIHLPLRKWDWFAVGFSDYGEFYPADYCVLWTGWKWGVKFEVRCFCSNYVNFNFLRCFDI